MVSREVGQAIYEDEAQIPEVLCKYESIKDMVAREPTEGSFTTVIIRGVRTELVKQFFERDQIRRDVRKLADDLGHTYQYFMTADPPDINGWPAKCLTIHPEQPLQLQLRLPGESEPIDTLDNLEHRFQKAAQNERWFFVRYYKGLAEATRSKAKDQVTEIQRNTTPHIALGVLRYFPSRNFAETHPMAGPALDEKDQPQEQTLPDIQVECRWQGQTLVKQTEKMGSLPFADRRIHRRDVADIPEVCFKRWRCCLFVSGHWDVGSNKMELALPDFSEELKYADFSQFMTTKELAVFGTYEDWNRPEDRGGSGGWDRLWKRQGNDNQPRQDFREWLRECHQTHDEDLKFEDSFRPENDVRSQLDPNDQAEGCCWRKVILAGGRELCRGDLFSFKPKGQQKGQPKNTKTVYAKAVVFCRDPNAEDGAGTVYYQRLPEQFYPKLSCESLASLIVDSKARKFTLLEYNDKKNQKAENQKKKHCKDAVAKELDTKCPHKFVISTARSGQPRAEVTEGAGVETESDVQQFFYVDIVNRNGESLSGRSDESVGAYIGDTKVKVRLIAAGPFESRDEAINADLNSNLNPNGDDPPTKPMQLNDRNGCYKRYRRAGFYAIDFECVLDTDEVKEKINAGLPLPATAFEFESQRREILEVKGSKAYQFDFAEGFEYKAGGMFDGGIRIGSTAQEEIELVLTDRHHNTIHATSSHVRGLSIVATAKKGNLTLEQRIDKSSGLKLTNAGTLLLTLSWKWPTSAAWKQPLSPPGRPAKFNVVLTSSIVRSTGTESLKRFSFGREYLELWPRAPTELLVDMAEVTIGDEEPALAVTFADENGNESSPIRGETRSVEVTMTFAGKTFKMCKPTAVENVQQAVASAWNRAYSERRFLTAFRSNSECQGVVTIKSASLGLQTDVSVRILQPQTPATAVVLCGVEEQETTVSANTSSLPNLRIQLKNILGNNVEWADQSPIKVKWNGEIIPVTADYVGYLPALDLSDKSSVAQSPYQFDGTASFRDSDGGSEIPLHFQVNLVAGNAVRWKIESHAQTVGVNQPGQLHSAISVLRVDADGNEGASDPDKSQPRVELLETSGTIKLTDSACKETSRAVKKFQLKRNACLEGQIDPTNPYVNLRVSDANSSLESAEFRLKVQPGEPSKVRLAHSMLTRRDGDDQYKANVPAHWELQGLEAMLVDACGNRVPQKDFVLNLTGKNVVCEKLKRRTDETGTATFASKSDLRPYRTLDNGAGSYTLEISGSRIAPARVNCVVELTNQIVGLAVEVDTDAKPTAGEVLPPSLVTVSVDTQDGEMFDPLPSLAAMFQVTIQQKVRRSWKAVATAAIVVSEEDGIGETTTWHTESDQEYTPLLAGQYKIECVCTDTRPGLSSEHQASATLEIAGGAAHRLEELMPMDCRHRVTNGSERTDRVAVQKLSLQVKDRNGNNTRLHTSEQEDSEIVATLHDSTSGSEIPNALEGDHAITVGAGDSGRFDFSEVRLREGVGGDTQRSMYIRFSVVGKDVECIDSAAFDYVPFRLFSTSSNVTRIDELTSQLHDVNKQLKSLDQVLDEWRQQLTDTEESITAKQAKLKSELELIGELQFVPADLFKQAKLEQFVAACEAVCAKIQRNNPKPRQAMRQKMPADGMRQYGVPVVDIGFVANEREARVLSWAAGPRIKAILAHDSAAQAKLDEFGRASFAEDQMVPFQVKEHSGEGRSRTASESRTCALPLQLPLGEGERVSFGRGNDVCIGRDIPSPQFAVNMFDLPSSKESYRDKLLWNIYQNTLVMHSIEDARRYRQACAKKRRFCPSIYTLDGRRIQSDG